MDDKEFAEALNRLLGRFAKIGWLDSTAISEGQIRIKLTAKGRERLGTLRDIIIDELDSALKFSEFQALMGIMLRLDSIESLPPLDQPPEN